MQDNALALLSMENIDVGLLGSWLIDAQTFTQTCKIAED